MEVYENTEQNWLAGEISLLSAAATAWASGPFPASSNLVCLCATPNLIRVCS